MALSANEATTERASANHHAALRYQFEAPSSAQAIIARSEIKDLAALICTALILEKYKPTLISFSFNFFTTE